MEPKRLMLAALALVALSGALWWSNKEEAKGEKKPGPDDAPKILEIAQDQIVKIELKRLGAEPVLLEKSASWALKAPKALGADQDAAAAVASALAVLSSDRLVADKIDNADAYGLNQPMMTVIVTRKDGKTHTLQLGSDTPSGSATYARVEGDPKLYTVATFTKTSLDKTWRDLRDKRLLPFDGEKLTRVETTAKGTTIEFGKNNANNWTMLKPKALRTDNFAAEELVRKLKEAKMEVTNDVEEEGKWPAKFAAAAVVGAAKVTDQKGTMSIEIRKDKDNAYFAKSSAVEGIFKTTQEAGEALGKGVDDYRNKKLFEFGFTEPDRVEVKQDGAVYSFSKVSNDWKKDGKSVEPGQIQQVIDKLRDLAATKFADAATGAVYAEYSVKAEKVVVTKQGETFYGKRADSNEAAVLDASALTEIKTLAAAVKEPAASAKPEEKKKK
ncbi:MAG: DUF4340 domain-containing protein [Acidobacteria bacterium]|nr:DUF4340 domain-containing protein [Acidobacteriota bacterium]